MLMPFYYGNALEAYKLHCSLQLGGNWSLESLWSKIRFTNFSLSITSNHFTQILDSRHTIEFSIG